MNFDLKPVSDQVIVITGGSSGIGLTTARMAAERGAKVVIAARNGEALQAIEQELRAKGHEVASCVADVSRKDEVEKIARTAIDRFGRIDSWVNDAAVAVYAELTELDEADHRRLFDVNYWGYVYGSLTAVEHMRRSGGGALVNIGSILSDISVPLQGAYVATKHAVKGFTNTLRMELGKHQVPVSVSLIKPGSIDTPYMEHAKTELPKAPLTPAPRYAPEIVARAILHCCEVPTRELYVGGAGRMLVAMQKMAPATFEMMAERMFYDSQFDEDRSALADADRRDNLYRPRADRATRSRSARGHARETSLYTELQMRPWMAGAAFAGLLVAAGSVLGARRAL